MHAVHFQGKEDWREDRKREDRKRERKLRGGVAVTEEL